DYGTVRLGIALSDELQMLAHPSETISMTNPTQAFARIAAVVLEKNVERIMVGLPRHLDGRLSESANKAQEFAESCAASSAAKFKPGMNGFQLWPRSAHCVRRENRPGKAAAMSTRSRRRSFCKVISIASSSNEVRSRRNLLPNDTAKA